MHVGLSLLVFNPEHMVVKNAGTTGTFLASNTLTSTKTSIILPTNIFVPLGKIQTPKIAHNALLLL
jgi:hypothetical protein